MKNLSEEVRKNREDIEKLEGEMKELREMLIEEEKVVLVVPRDKESSRSVFKYLHKNAIEYELIGGGVILGKSYSKEIRNYFKDILLEEKSIISSGEMDYREVQRLREKHREGM
ncbi:MAG: hypothetical protein ABIA78_00510 [archaeon]